MSNPEEDFFEHARREMFPKMKGSVFSAIILGDPDPKLCLELGAAILFDKPILLIVPRGRAVPLSLRTIAHKIVEVDPDNFAAANPEMKSAIDELVAASQMRGRS